MYQMEKQEVLKNLRKQILLMEGFKAPSVTEDTPLGRMSKAFGNGVFPFAALHEFFCFNPEEASASSAFIAALLSSRLKKSGPAVWISTNCKIFPPALRWFGIEPHQVLFLNVKKDKDISWAVNEALGCSSLSAVIGEMPELCITASRRFQLTIEEAGVGCFVLRNKPKNLLTTAVSRWHIQPLHSNVEDDFPGLGFPRWQVKLLKVRNGTTGSWDVEWAEGGFRYAPKISVMHAASKKKTG